jgi:hypothetical protein
VKPPRNLHVRILGLVICGCCCTEACDFAACILVSILYLGVSFVLLKFGLFLVGSRTDFCLSVLELVVDLYLGEVLSQLLIFPLCYSSVLCYCCSRA